MAKSYSEQLEDWVEQRASSRRDKNLVRFLAVRGDVKLALDAGFAVSTIWGNMRETGRIDFSYDTFLKYVNRIVRNAHRAKVGSGSWSRPDARNENRKAKPTPLEAVPGFTFNPSVKMEDLI